MLFFPALAHAHLMAADQATVNVVRESIFCAISVPASALHDGDRAAVTGEIARRFRVTEDGVAPATVSLDLAQSPAHDGGAASFVALWHARFSHAPKKLEVQSDLFAPNATLTLLVTAHDYKESQVLGRTHTTHTFVVAPGPSAPTTNRAGICVALMALALITYSIWKSNYCS